MNMGYTAAGWTYLADEHHIYGSSRVGVHNTHFVLAKRFSTAEMEYTQKTGNQVHFIRGNRNYELSNHLGNVQVVISDKRISVCDNELQTERFEADILMATDYYPFGMAIPERQWYTGSDSSNYRFGFGGHEKIEEVSGSGNTVDMGDRWYDVRLGKTFKFDRKGFNFPNISPYSFAANNPLYFIDPDGQVIEPYSKTKNFGLFTSTTYPYFLGGITGTHGEAFHKAKTSLINNSTIFKKVYEQLESSTNFYRFTETNITPSGVKEVMKQNNLKAKGYFQRSHTGKNDDPYIINFNFTDDKTISGHNDQEVIFEEVFHAGQNEFYKEKMPSSLDIEVEAKVISAIEGINSEFYYDGFNDFRTALKDGSATESQRLLFELKLWEYAAKVSKQYMEYYISLGNSKQEAENLYGMKNFTGELKYGESLYGNSINATGVEVEVD